MIPCLFCLFIVGCAEDPISTANTSNAKINVDTLFEYDGVRVYRFNDVGEYRYFARVIGKSEAKTFDDYTVHQGKSSTTYHHEIETEDK